MKGRTTMRFGQEAVYSPILKCFETSPSKQSRLLGLQIQDVPQIPPIPNHMLLTLLVLTIACFLTFTYHAFSPF